MYVVLNLLRVVLRTTRHLDITERKDLESHNKGPFKQDFRGYLYIQEVVTHEISKFEIFRFISRHNLLNVQKPTDTSTVRFLITF
ncbi:hypothetical protein HanPSC8_Chr16g0704891 [Helianthus annuus]|nr:hypothetical protein HanPSC8_Chr16g0704891 [Helianthus annuus]